MVVTYRTAAAAFVATNTIKHHAEQRAREYPLGSLCVTRDFYVDDMLTGADSITDALAIRDQTIQLLREGSFKLSKWGSNCPELLSGVSCLLGPTIVIAKLVLQDLWQSGLDWDESVPQDAHTKWMQFKLQLPNIKELQIPRCVRGCADHQDIEIHGFCDASQRAYGACVYIRIKVGQDEYKSFLLCSKSRVAPLKAVTLARLELLAALLLAQLADKARASLNLSSIKITLWSDATIALHWISSPSRKWTTFVANHEYDSLTKHRDISKTSNLLCLSPFMDEDRLVRVGGRLKNSALAFDARHQIVLPRNHELSKRIIELEHVRNMHSGLQATMAAAYISVFVCFATKAVHLELVSDLTTDALIAALKRLISRRGKPERIYSDNATNFVGAQKQIKELYDFLKADGTRDHIEHFLREQKTEWSFIPPNAPHHGELWEAAVKSVKFHLARIVSSSHLTFEEMQTVLCEIEAILNSRPITPLSSDPNDMTYLSPGHFLVGAPLNSFPTSDLNDINVNKLLRWQVIEQMRQHFWRRWSHEYLNTLQQRNKWKTSKGQQLKTGQLVIIKQQTTAPLQWPIGRVQEIHTGSDGVARSATVKTSKGSYVRPLAKLAILPA
ncbi:uncharacterized protein [Temnothorax nylanderi]|uniref:uncharacterized protein n=1 Tax=Temnothorax nylanderi TaxID=102681 RepID=UPI003A88FA28